MKLLVRVATYWLLSSCLWKEAASGTITMTITEETGGLRVQVSSGALGQKGSGVTSVAAGGFFSAGSGIVRLSRSNNVRWSVRRYDIFKNAASPHDGICMDESSSRTFSDIGSQVPLDYIFGFELSNPSNLIYLPTGYDGSYSLPAVDVSIASTTIRSAGLRYGATCFQEYTDIHGGANRVEIITLPCLTTDSTTACIHDVECCGEDTCDTSSGTGTCVSNCKDEDQFCETGECCDGLTCQGFPTGNFCVPPTPAPTPEPTPAPVTDPTQDPTSAPTPEPTPEPTPQPTSEPTPQPTMMPSSSPSSIPSQLPSSSPSSSPTMTPCDVLDNPCLFTGQLRIPGPSQGSCCEDLVCIRSVPDISVTPTCQYLCVEQSGECILDSDGPGQCCDDLVCTTTQTGNFCDAPTDPPTPDPTPEPTPNPTSAPSSEPSLAPSAAPTTCDAETMPCLFTGQLMRAIPGPSQGSCCEGLVCVRDVPDIAVAPVCRPITSSEFEPCSLTDSSKQQCSEGLICSSTEEGNFCLSMPSASPSMAPTPSPTDSPSASPSKSPTPNPTGNPTVKPSSSPSAGPTSAPSAAPSSVPSDSPSSTPSGWPSGSPSMAPSCGSVDHPNECMLETECWPVYGDQATGCSMGTCLCGDQVCGCLEGEEKDEPVSGLVGFVEGGLNWMFRAGAAFWDKLISILNGFLSLFN